MRGEKKYEYRRCLFKRKNVSRVFIYATSPVKRIIGCFSIKRILHDSPECLWERSKHASGLNEEDFYDYFKGNDHGFAIEIDEVITFDNPVDPKEVLLGFVPPQSFCYLQDPSTIIAAQGSTR